MTDAPTSDELAQRLAEHELWLQIERGASPNTVAAYRRDLRRYAAFLRARGVHDAQSVDEDLIAEYVGSLRAERTDEGSARYQASSVARMVVAVRSFHRFCLEEAVVDADPSSEIGAPRVPQGIPKALSEQEIEAILAVPAGDAPMMQRDRAMLETLYATGVRISELVGLDLGDIDVDHGMLRVLGKGGKERVVPVGRAARNALEDYLRDGRLELVRPGVRAADAVFISSRGTRITRQACWQIVQKAAARAGIEAHLSPHVFRHSCATHLIEHGADIRVVQELLGHARVSTTQVYTKVSPERLRSVYDAAHPRARRAG